MSPWICKVQQKNFLKKVNLKLRHHSEAKNLAQLIYSHYFLLSMINYHIMTQPRGSSTLPLIRRVMNMLNSE